MDEAEGRERRLRGKGASACGARSESSYRLQVRGFSLTGVPHPSMDARVPRSTASPGIVETVETQGPERCAELVLAWHRGEPRAALRTHSWLLASSGFTRFILLTSWTLSPDSTETKAIFPENPEGWLRRTTVTTDHRDEFALSHICALWSLPVGQVDALRRDDH